MSPESTTKIAEQIIAAVQAEHGEEVWIGDGYAAGDDLRVEIAQALDMERATTQELRAALEPLACMKIMPSDLQKGPDFALHFATNGSQSTKVTLSDVARARRLLGINARVTDYIPRRGS